MNTYMKVLAVLLILASYHVSNGQDSQERIGEDYSEIKYEGKSIQEWKEQFQSDDKNLCRQAAEALIEIGKPAYPALAEAMGYCYAPNHRQMVDAMAAIGAPAIPALLELIVLERSGDYRHNGGIAAISQMGEKAVPALRQALLNENDRVYLPAVIALQIQVYMDASEDVLDLLRESLTDHPSHLVRTAAAEGLGVANMSTRPSKKTEKALTHALSDSNRNVQGMAAVSLVRLGAWQGKDLVPILTWSLRNGEEILPNYAASALGELGLKAEPAIPELWRILKDESSYISSEAATSLGKIGGRAVPLLLKSLDNPDERIRSLVKSALENFTGKHDLPLADTSRLLAHEETSVRKTAVSLLGKSRQVDQKVVETIISACEDKDREVRQEAIKVLGTLDTPATTIVPLLIAMVDNVKEPERTTIFEALGNIGRQAESSIDVLAANIESNPYPVAQALWKMGPKAIPILIDALDHADGSVRTTAADALACMGPAASQAIPALTKLVRIDEPSCSSAIQALETMGPKAAPAVPALVNILRNDKGTLEWRALGALAAIGTGAKTAKPEIAAICNHDDKSRRLDAAKTMIAIGEETESIDVLRELINEEYPIRDLALHAISKVSQPSKGAITLLTELMGNQSIEPYYRIAYAEALDRIDPDSKTGERFLRNKVHKLDDAFTLRAAYSLAKTGKADDKIVQTLKPGLLGDDQQTVLSCAWALILIKSQREYTFEILEKMLQSENEQLRVGAAMAITSAGIIEPTAIEILGSRLNVNDKISHSANVVRILGTIADKSKRAKEYCQSALYSKDPSTRTAAQSVPVILAQFED